MNISKNSYMIIIPLDQHPVVKTLASSSQYTSLIGSQLQRLHITLVHLGRDLYTDNEILDISKLIENNLPLAPLTLNAKSVSSSVHNREMFIKLEVSSTANRIENLQTTLQSQIKDYLRSKKPHDQRIKCISKAPTHITLYRNKNKDKTAEAIAFSTAHSLVGNIYTQPLGMINFKNGPSPLFTYSLASS